jgi:hypothetical protein
MSDLLKCSICLKKSLRPIFELEGRLDQSGNGYKTCKLYECTTEGCTETRVWREVDSGWKTRSLNSAGRYDTRDTGKKES